MIPSAFDGLEVDYELEFGRLLNREIGAKAVTAVVDDNGQSVIDDLFKEKKAVGAVLCMAFCPIVAKHPDTEKAVVMPLKIAILIDLYTGRRMSQDLLTEITLVNHAMQLVRGGWLCLDRFSRLISGTSAGGRRGVPFSG
jgi:hypothetical protein